MRTKTLSTFGYLLGVFPLGLAFCGLAVTFAGAQWLANREARDTQQHTDSEARHVAAQLSVGLSETFTPLERIATWWLMEGRPLAPEDWQTDTKLFVTSKAGIRKLVWLDRAGKPVWSARPGAAADEKPAAGLESVFQTTHLAARKSAALAISPVFDFEGSPAVYACAPVYRGRGLSGYVGGVYGLERLIRSLLEGQLPDGYAVSVEADGRRVDVPAQPAGGGEEEFRHRVPVSFADATWFVEIAPVKADTSPLRQPVMSFGVLISLLLYMSAAIARLARLRARELQAANARLEVENHERRRAEQQVAQLNRDLQRKLAEFQTLLDVLPVGIAVAEDPDCRRIWTNRALATMLNVPYGTNISQSPAGGETPPANRMLRGGAEVAPQDLPMQTAARTAAPVSNVDLEIVRDDGAVLHTLSYAAPLFDEHGNVRGVINACVDITARKQLESRLQQAEKFQSLALMAGGIAHDFNNLLTVIIGNASSISGLMVEGSKGAAAAVEIQEAAGRAADLVSKLLAFTGSFWREMKPLAISEEIESMLPRLREIVPESIAIRCKLEPKLPLIEAGSSDVQQVLMNLSLNAAEALEGAESGQIELRAVACDLSAEEIAERFPDQQLRPGSYVRIEVADNGCGIPEDILARVFDPFFTTKFLGRGLGLSAVQGIVRAHGGGIRISSSPHRGARVEIVFPAFAPALRRAS